MPHLSGPYTGFLKGGFDNFFGQIADNALYPELHMHRHVAAKPRFSPSRAGASFFEVGWP